MLDINIKKIKRIEDETGLLCVDDCIATLADYHNRRYEMMYIDGYYFCGLSGKINFASQYNIGVVNRYENLKKYHGLFFSQLDIDDKKELVGHIKEVLDNNIPLLVYFNPFYCPWDFGYQKFFIQSGHAFIVRGITSTELICMDPYFNKESINISYDLFFKGADKIFLCQVKKTVYFSNNEYVSLVRNLFFNLINNKYFEMLRCFISDLNSNTDIFFEVASEDKFWNSPIVVRILEINQSIQNMALSIEYIATRTEGNSDKLKYLSIKIWNLAIQWKQARKLIIKLYFIKKENPQLKKRIVERMNDIIDEFEYIAEEYGINNCVYTTKHCYKDGNESSLLIKKSIPIDKYCNNKAVLSLEDVNNGNLYADFTSAGHCYVSERENKPYISFNNDTFDINNFINKKKDNIACNGQIIDGINGKYKKIVIIGSAEFGNSSDILKIYSADNNEYELEIQFTDYVFEPQFNEEVVWKGRGIHKIEAGYEWMAEKLYLYRQEYELPQERITKIKLPINISLHIFTIILYEIL
jgi:hypothetical protein